MSPVLKTRSDTVLLELMVAAFASDFTPTTETEFVSEELPDTLTYWLLAPEAETLPEVQKLALDRFVELV
jgi:hypothetical protein